MRDKYSFGYPDYTVYSGTDDSMCGPIDGLILFIGGERAVPTSGDKIIATNGDWSFDVNNIYFNGGPLHSVRTKYNYEGIRINRDRYPVVYKTYADGSVSCHKLKYNFSSNHLKEHVSSMLSSLIYPHENAESLSCVHPFRKLKFCSAR